MFLNFIDALDSRLKKPLPGEDVQYLMSPAGRLKLKDIDLSKTQKSAVLVLLFPHKDTIESTLIVRPQYNGVHSGQVAFPGGKFENEDIHLKNTALRETHEEIGVNPNTVNIIGNLTDVYINPSNFLVTPFVGYTPQKPDFIPNIKEVDKIITFDVINFENKTIQTQKPIKLSMGFEINAPCYEMNDLTVWGATAMMICEFNNIVNSVKKALI